MFSLMWFYVCPQRCQTKSVKLGSLCKIDFYVTPFYVLSTSESLANII